MHLLRSASELSPEERTFYHDVEQSAAAQFKRYLRANEVYENYSSILVLITKLRQAANHPHLVTKFNGYMSITDQDSQADSITLPKQIESRLEPLKETLMAGASCSICLDLVDVKTAVVTLCTHVYCSDCITQWRDASESAHCPECRQSLTQDPMTPVTAVTAVIAKRLEIESSSAVDKPVAAKTTAEQLEWIR
eukprot:SAG31_NODE_535_length_14348_cov_11.339603_16_plen_194_part_00